MSPQPGFWTILLKSGDFEKLGWGDIVFLKMTEDSERDFFGTPCSVCVWNITWQITSIVHHLYLVLIMEQQPSDWPWKVSAIIVIGVVWHTDCMKFNKTVFLAILCDRIWCDYIWFVIDYSWVLFCIWVGLGGFLSWVLICCIHCKGCTCLLILQFFLTLFKGVGSSNPC